MHSSVVKCLRSSSENRVSPTLIHILNRLNCENKNNYYSVLHCRQYGLLATLLETVLCAETMYWTVISCPLYCSKSVLICSSEFCSSAWWDWSLFCLEKQLFIVTDKSVFFMGASFLMYLKGNVLAVAKLKLFYSTVCADAWDYYRIIE